jgi:non-ribosomal peptide synthetase component E (peptide arylation enzyme)
MLAPQDDGSAFVPARRLSNDKHLRDGLLMNLAHHLEMSARTYPHRPAIGYSDGVLHNYAQLAGRVAGIAGALRERFGLVEGDRVAIVSSNRPEYVKALYAIWHAGLVGVPANAKLHGAELNYILGHSGARVCFASPDLATVIEARPRWSISWCSAAVRSIRCSPPIRSRSRRAGRTISPGCSILRAPPGAPRARC